MMFGGIIISVVPFACSFFVNIRKADNMKMEYNYGNG